MMNWLSPYIPVKILLLAVIGVGCAGTQANKNVSLSTENKKVVKESEELEESEEIKPVSYADETTDTEGNESTVELISDESNPDLSLPDQISLPETELQLEDVIQSVYTSYPMVESAFLSQDVASGKNLSAYGAFDLKLKGASENGPEGFYKTYRQSIGLIQPLYSGSEIWGGYRIGRGSFQPWYLERQTNDGGEFKAGMTVPLMQNKTIDERRANLWKSEIEMDLTNYDIQAQIIGFVQEASYAYWEWIAAGRKYDIANQILELSESRTERIKKQVEAGLIDPPELTDNLRLVAQRRAAVAAAERKINQKAAKLSLYFRDSQGVPILPEMSNLTSFPEPYVVNTDKMKEDVQFALNSRPDIKIYDLFIQQTDVDLNQARNELKPEVNAVVWGSQDVGGATSSKRDKSPFELEASLFLDVPLQRRKALGKIQSLEAKIQQMQAKRRFTVDKITVEVQIAYAGLIAAYKQVKEAKEAAKLAKELASREFVNFEAGASDLLKVTLREQYAIEASMKEVDALLAFFQAQADYHAALAIQNGQ